jgi:hopene-associated glycosyltransferase HpnB
VAQAGRGHDMVSEMVALRCVSWAERALVPAFVFFFQLLYPFHRVNDPASRMAAAAGGTVLIRRATLERIGGVAAVRGALIDDVTLATAVKRAGGRIWLGHSLLARSERPYQGAADIWRMVARTAYVQLRRNPVILLGTVLGLALVWLVPPFMALFGHGAARWMGLAAWVGLTASYLPTLRRFGRSPLWALALPLVAVFYMAATVGSAVDHHFGRGVQWKSRAYQGSQT